MEKNTTWMVQKPQGSPPMITTWSTSGTPAWHRLFLRSHKKKKRLDLADCFGTFGSEFSFFGRGFGKWRKNDERKDTHHFYTAQRTTLAALFAASGVWILCSMFLGSSHPEPQFRWFWMSRNMHQKQQYIPPPNILYPQEIRLFHKANNYGKHP